MPMIQNFGGFGESISVHQNSLSQILAKIQIMIRQHISTKSVPQAKLPKFDLPKFYILQ